MNINGIGFLNTISQHVIFATEIMIKKRKVKSIEYGIKQVNKLYLKCDLKITHLHAENEF